MKTLDVMDETLDLLCLLIGSEKKSRVDKFVNKRDKIRTVIGEIIIRTIIAEKLGINNKDIKLHRKQYEKPCF